MNLSMDNKKILKQVRILQDSLYAFGRKLDALHAMEREEEAIQLLKKGKIINLELFRKKFDTSYIVSHMIMKILLKKGYIKRTGKKGNYRYIVVKEK